MNRKRDDQQVVSFFFCLLISLKNKTPVGQNSSWSNDGKGGFTDEPPKEGETKEERVNFGTLYLPNFQYISKFYHAGGVEGSKTGWYTIIERYTNN